MGNRGYQLRCNGELPHDRWQGLQHIDSRCVHMAQEAEVISFKHRVVADIVLQQDMTGKVHVVSGTPIRNLRKKALLVEVGHQSPEVETHALCVFSGAEEQRGKFLPQVVSVARGELILDIASPRKNRIERHQVVIGIVYRGWIQPLVDIAAHERRLVRKECLDLPRRFFTCLHMRRKGSCVTLIGVVNECPYRIRIGHVDIAPCLKHVMDAVGTFVQPFFGKSTEQGRGRTGIAYSHVTD